ncbi:hypothetical protein TcasGA2_TC004323 [Tribolium castaneum]|uniref:Uncharacterized protein n=1 Tax=Tribolium castaneum TaxID=7070 RepID=D6X136_TRICA|nr:hypothetical protein TcasGA2_TC004323 [Tribolium castaneum]
MVDFLRRLGHISPSISRRADKSGRQSGRYMPGRRRHRRRTPNYLRRFRPNNIFDNYACTSTRFSSTVV